MDNEQRPAEDVAICNLFKVEIPIIEVGPITAVPTGILKRLDAHNPAFVYLVKMPFCPFKNALQYPLAKCPYSKCPLLGILKKSILLRNIEGHFLKSERAFHIRSLKCPPMPHDKIILFLMPFLKRAF